MHEALWGGSESLSFCIFYKRKDFCRIVLVERSTVNHDAQKQSTGQPRVFKCMFRCI